MRVNEYTPFFCNGPRDVKCPRATVAAFIRLAMIRIMLRRLAGKCLAINPNFPDGLLGTFI
jgi:hypothetical protein